MGKKIVLLGTAPASMGLAPQGAGWEIWSCSPGTYGMPGLIKFFELHRWEPQQEWFSDGYMQFLKDFKGDVIMTEQVDDIPNCKVLDHKMLTDHFGPYFFTSSLAWMCAMAILEKPEKIAFYGVDMAARTEYENQRMGCQYFAMIGKAYGIEVGVPPESDLLRPAPLYGVCEQSHGYIKQTSRARELSGRLKVLEEETKDRIKQISFVQGALDDQDWAVRSWFGAVDGLGREFCEPPDVPALTQLLKPEVGNGEFKTYETALKDHTGMVIDNGQAVADNLKQSIELGAVIDPAAVAAETVPFEHARIKAPPKKKRGRPKASHGQKSK